MKKRVRGNGPSALRMKNGRTNEWTDLRDMNEKTHTYEDRPNFRDFNKISEC